MLPPLRHKRNLILLNHIIIIFQNGTSKIGHFVKYRSLPMMGLVSTKYFIRILESSKIIAHFVQWLIGFNSIWPEIKVFYFICEALNVSSWDEEGLFVHPFIWQRNCKKRDLFNGSFSSQLGAVVGSVMAPVMTLIQWSNLMAVMAPQPQTRPVSIPSNYSL